MKLRRTVFPAITAILAITWTSHGAQEQADAELWKPFRHFLGSWLGEETGASGIGKGERSYKMVVGGRFLLSQNFSRFEPQEKNPRGEVHEDWVLFSYDKERKNFMARGFFSEGYVIRYAMDAENSGETKFVFLSEVIENGPQLRTRLTLELKGDHRFDETFEISESGKEFKVLIKNYWKRKG